MIGDPLLQFELLNGQQIDALLDGLEHSRALRLDDLIEKRADLSLGLLERQSQLIELACRFAALHVPRALEHSAGDFEQAFGRTE